MFVHWFRHQDHMLSLHFKYLGCGIRRFDFIPSHTRNNTTAKSTEYKWRLPIDFYSIFIATFVFTFFCHLRCNKLWFTSSQQRTITNFKGKKSQVQAVCDQGEKIRTLFCFPNENLLFELSYRIEQLQASLDLSLINCRSCVYINNYAWETEQNLRRVIDCGP